MSYPGSKGQDGVWQRIIGQMPPHSVYVEPFFGSGRIFHAKLSAANSVLIDKSLSVFNQSIAELEGVECLHGDALEWIPLLAQRKLVDSEGVRIGMFLDNGLIYCDPPYPLSTRGGRKYYEHEMSDEDHAALLSTLLQLKCYVMISSYPNALYLEHLREWRCVRYQTMTRGGKRTECLWCNFPEPETLHDWRYAGRNFRERCAFKRVEKRWLAKLDAMTPRKRGYVLNAIQSRILAPETARRDPKRPGASDVALRTGG
jgi:hypothetical protein